MIYIYADDGTRLPFAPEMLVNRGGCLLCGHPARDFVGVFVPTTDEMRAVVLKLRQAPTRPHSISALAYGLCNRCLDIADVYDRVEDALEAAAARVVIQ